MVDCPLCERQIFTSDGICPGCNTNLNDEAAVQRQRVKRKAISAALAARAQGASYGEIETQLVKDGIDDELVREIMIQVEGKTPAAITEKDNRDMRHGLNWLLIGIFVTLVTFFIAAASQNGGVYIIAYGAILAGGLQFLRGWLRSKRKK